MVNQRFGRKGSQNCDNPKKRLPGTGTVPVPVWLLILLSGFFLYSVNFDIYKTIKNINGASTTKNVITASPMDSPIESPTASSTTTPTSASTATPTAIPSTLENLLSCKLLEVATNRNEKEVMMPTINFFAAAVGEKYEDLLPMYVYYALVTHWSLGIDAIAEIVVPNMTSFIHRHQNALVYLQKTVQDKYGINDTNKNHLPMCVREYSSNHASRTDVTNTWRFLEVPSRSAKYTYIGDIDIFLLQSVLDPKRLRQMEVFKLPYSNIVRDYDANPRRLTGLILVDTDHFYTEPFRRSQKATEAKGNDEAFLYNVVVHAGFGIPPRNFNSTNSLDKDLNRYRPGHGVHLSYNRGPGKRMCSGVGSIQYHDLITFEGVKEYKRHDKVAKRTLDHLEVIFQEEERLHMTVIDGKCQPRNESRFNKTD